MPKLQNLIDLEKFNEEKEIDLNQMLSIEVNNNIHVLPLRKVILFIYSCPAELQRKIARNIIKIDFHNGDIMDFYKYLAKGMLAGY